MEQQLTVFEKLISHLNQLVFVYRALFTIAETKKQDIITNNIQGVNKLTLQESKLIDKIADNEEAIRKCILDLQREMGFRPKLKMKLTELSTMVINVEEKQLLDDIINELKDITIKLKQANELNQELTETALDYINFSIGVMSDNPNEEMTYRHPMLDKKKF